MRNAFRLQPLFLALLVACQSKPAARPGVVTSTSLLTVIVKAVGGDAFSVQTVAPAIACPGHFDVKPVDVIAASRARLVLNHGWEPWFPNFAAAVANATRDQQVKPRFVTAATPGNWMIPEVHKAAAKEVTDLLIEVMPESAAAFRRNLTRYAVVVDSAAAEAQALFAGRRMPAILASDKQAAFLRWLGFRVVAEYGRAEDCTAHDLAELARVARDSAVTLIVDNLQSGPDAGLPLAEALNARHVTLTNFPLDTDYRTAVLDNARKLRTAIEE
ncbi:MAG: zinc ABC transporter substrate-binding protein [candidate division WOR-3 bacterium]